MSLKEYNVDLSHIDEWLPWGGITLPHVMQNKDGSFFSVIRYGEYPIESPKIHLPQFGRGWTLWIERDHGKPIGQEDYIYQDYLVIAWNPFILPTKKVKNTLGPMIKDTECLEYFGSEIQSVATAMAAVTSAHILEYQEILDFLAFSLDFGKHPVKIPEIPMYLDVLLSQDIEFKFEPNGIKLDDEHIIVISMLGKPPLKTVFHAFSNISYRHVRRVCCMNEKQAQKDIKKYTDAWCAGRKYVKKGIFEDLLVGDIKGYFSEYFIFTMNDKNYDNFLEFVTDFLNRKKLLYRIEQYNLKDKWWGSLAGIFRADVEPPATFFSAIGDLLMHPDEKKVTHQFDNAIKKMETIQLKKGSGL